MNSRAARIFSPERGGTRRCRRAGSSLTCGDEEPAGTDLGFGDGMPFGTHAALDANDPSTGLPFDQGWMRCNALETDVDHHCLFSSTSAEPPIILAKSSSRSIASGNWIQAGIFLWSVAQPQPVTDYEDAAAAAWSFIDAALAMVRDGGPQPRHLLIRQPGLLSLRFVSLKHAEETKSIASGPGKPRGGSVTTVRIARIAGRSTAERSAVTSRTWVREIIGLPHDAVGGRRRTRSVVAALHRVYPRRFIRITERAGRPSRLSRNPRHPGITPSKMTARLKRKSPQ